MVSMKNVSINGNNNVVNIDSEYRPTTITGNFQIDLENLKQFIQSNDKDGNGHELIMKVKAMQERPYDKVRAKVNFQEILDIVGKYSPIGILITNLLIHYSII